MSEEFGRTVNIPMWDFEPRPDITAAELALIVKAIQLAVSHEYIVAMGNASRHFKKQEDGSKDI